MNKKKNQLSYYLIAAVVLIVAVVLLSRGGGTADDVAKLHAALNAEGQTSLQLIDQAVLDGELDEETALVLKIYSVFGNDEDVPSEYRSDKLFHDGTPEVREMVRKWEGLTDDTKALLEPYRKRPNEEGSWVESIFDTAKPTSFLVPNAYATRPAGAIYTDFLESTDGKAKIWYPNADSNRRALFNEGTTGERVTATQAKKMAQKIKGFLDNDEIITEFETLLQKQLMSDGTAGGDGKLDIYVAPCGSDLGITYAEHSTPTPSYIIMNSSIGLANDNVLKTTLAHEIFHSFQYAYGYDDTKDNWWGEATAVWSEDFIYPAANTEHGWLSHFVPHPKTSADKETPPSEHHYGAYIFSYFLTENFGDDFMRKSWQACDGNPCIDGIDSNIEGGLKDQWKEFTLWNYNKEPAKYYMDMGPFPTDSSADSDTTEDTFLIGGSSDDQIDIGELKPLSAELDRALNQVTDEKVKKLVFKGFNDFTRKSDKTAIKAIIYYKNGQKEIEDWTKKQRRSFCLENKDEDFDKIVLIFSNGAKKDTVSASNIKVESKSTCFEISQRDEASAVIHFPYMERGVNKIVDINTDIEILSEGEPTEKASEEVKYAYMTKWKMWHEFEQIRKSFKVDCDGSTVDFAGGWTTRSAGDLVFDLNLDEANKDGVFPIDLHYGGSHPKGNFEIVPDVAANCISKYVSGGKIDLSAYKGVSEGIWQGKITDMTEDGAKIEIPNSCLYHNCATQDGSPFQTMEKPIILEIKKQGS